LYQEAKCFVLPSYEEGFGMVILEAMACGIPVVSTRCGGPNDIVLDGENGYLVDIGDVNAMAEKILALCIKKKIYIKIFIM
jgi:glycosyltransferase involved in cell wall biosynthesis